MAKRAKSRQVVKEGMVWLPNLVVQSGCLRLREFNFCSPSGTQNLTPYRLFNWQGVKKNICGLTSLENLEMQNSQQNSFGGSSMRDALR